MSARKVKKLTRRLNYTAVWAADVLTVTTEATHYLKTGDIVSLFFADSPQEKNNVAVTVTDVAEFTIPLVLASSNTVQTSGSVVIPYFSAGMTGEQPSFTITKTESAPTVIQFTAHGAGGAVLVLSVSNDGDGWVEIATVTLASSNHATDFVSISPMWTQAKISITSIGALTSVVTTVTA